MSNATAAPHRDPLRRAIAAACRADERECVARLAAAYRSERPAPQQVAAQARRLALAVRASRHEAPAIARLMHEFSLASDEGVALMCLAEALLRIPDAATADRLIRDKIGHGDWRAHLGHGETLFVHAAAWGLYLGGRLVATHSERGLGNALARALARGGEPLLRRAVGYAMQLLGEQFVMGQTIEDALARSHLTAARGYRHSFDMLGEAALTGADAVAYHRAYAGAIGAVAATAAGRGVAREAGVSVKLSALHPRYCRAQRHRVMAELLPRLADLAQRAAQAGIGFNIDAEESDRLELSLDLIEALAFDARLAGWQGLGYVVQAYQKRALPVVDAVADLARRSGRRLMLRLVKGAYWDAEIKRAQVEGLAFPVFTRKAHTDLSYLVCAARLLATGDALYPQFATHNAHTLAAVAGMAAARGVTDFEFQCLHGMGESLYDEVIADGHRCRIYAPVGSHATLLPYLVRRLLENGANASFVHRIVDPAVAVEELAADPLDDMAAGGGTPHPAIAPATDLYAPQRRNSAGVDLADEDVLARLDVALARSRADRWHAAPLLARTPQRAFTASRAITNPARRAEVVGEVCQAAAEDVAAAVAAAADFARPWHEAGVAHRAACLERAADALEAAGDELMTLIVREAGRTRANALAEVREAADFCRYYAAQARALMPAGATPGPVACISPWNFPLAIFVGQIAGALAAGSPVLAKPAEQTPLVAARAIRLLHAAGIPLAALQLLPGAGETVGEALVADPRLAGVLFTGSEAVARRIDRRLAGRGLAAPWLVAETGGLNALIADSSALAEQLVQDVLVSAFDSAGQRCSSLRLLCLQRDTADRILDLLRAAMAELRLGDPAELATDVGPVIDEAARQDIEAHVAAMQAAGWPVFRLPPAAACGCGSFVAPTLVELDSAAALRREVFGPVLHVLRYDADRLDALLDAVNASGYGLTMGLHSRVDETIARVAARARVGNLYVNRKLIGAVVGTQPFGGEGRSGTGPKAGGPLFLHRLAGTGEVAPLTLGLPCLQAAPVPPALERLRDWARETGRHALAERCDHYARVSLLGHLFALPGPTGETNTLGFAARGRVLCRAVDEPALLEQLAACLATGNVAVVDSPRARSALAALPADIVVGNVADGGSPAALLSSDAAPDRALYEAADQPLVAVIRPLPGPGGYPLHRLVCERVLTVNTTAAGGNASLMSLRG